MPLSSFPYFPKQTKEFPVADLVFKNDLRLPSLVLNQDDSIVHTAKSIKSIFGFLVKKI